MKTVQIEEVENATIHNSNTTLSPEDISNMSVKISDKELISTVTTYYSGNYHKLINDIFNCEFYEIYDGDKEKLAIAVIKSMLSDDSYEFDDIEKHMLKGAIAVFKNRTRTSYY